MIGQFTSIDGKEYTVRITLQNGETPEEELTLGAAPFVTNMSESDKLLYIPAKYSSATLTLISEGYPFYLYSAEAQGVKVELIKDDWVAWTGYVTPCMYDQGFKELREEIEVECIDALSTLQYIKYSSQRQIKSFKDIILSIIRKCNAYNSVNISASTFIRINEENVLGFEAFKISEQCFYDELKEGQTIDEVAWTCKDVLEQICQYLGVTAVAYGDAVWLIDYDALKNGNREFIRYPIQGGDGYRVIPSNTLKTITADEYSGSDAKISLDNVYNKIKITAKNEGIEDILTSQDFQITNCTKGTDPTASAYNRSSDDGILCDMLNPELVSNFGILTNNRIAVIGQTTWNNRNSADNPWMCIPYVNFVRYENDENMRLFRYGSNFNMLSNPDECSYSYAQLTNGAYLMDCQPVAVANDWRIYTTFHKGREPADDANLFPCQNAWKNIRDAIWGKDKIKKLNLDRVIMLVNRRGTGHITRDYCKNYFFVEIHIPQAEYISGGQNQYIVISGKVQRHRQENFALPLTEEFTRYYNEEDFEAGMKNYINTNSIGLMCQLQWGDLYWDGSKWGYVYQAFRVSCNPDGKFDWTTTQWKDWYGKWFSIYDTSNYRYGSSASGYYIPLPDKELIHGTPILRIFAPEDALMSESKNGGNYVPFETDYTFIKDLKFELVKGDPTYSSKSKTDTVYTNIINKDNVQDLEEIKFDISTYDGKAPSFAAVVYQDGDKYYYVDKTINTALQEEEVTPSEGDGMRQEEHYLFRIANQYKEPSIKLQLPVRNNHKPYEILRCNQFGNKLFVVDSFSTDYKMNTQEINIVEKK